MSNAKQTTRRWVVWFGALMIWGMSGVVSHGWGGETRQQAQEAHLLTSEKLAGSGVWIDPALKARRNNQNRLVVKVWFEDQFLGDGQAYLRRAKEFQGHRRRDLRQDVVATLKQISQASYAAARPEIDRMIEQGTLRDFERHWIINGFTCKIRPDALEELSSITGVKKLFLARVPGRVGPRPKRDPQVFEEPAREPFDPERYRHPWYVRSLLADKVWKEFGVTGAGTLNIIHDFHFTFSENVTRNLYRNPSEIPGNGLDDDGNGLIDDYHGFHFDLRSPHLAMNMPRNPQGGMSGLHGFLCAAIVCGSGLPGKELEFGIAPRARWAGVIASTRLEAAIEWAIEQGADTYSMSFSIPNLGEYRSHWRKVMEQGSFCGIYFVSGAGNFAQQVPVPVQMRTPEDIPEVVFAATGVQRDLRRTPFSSKGPVVWNTEHYQDGRVPKPEVCAFNSGLPALLPDGTSRPASANGNSFAGPMFCGTIALMLSADPDLLPWDLKEIITSTASDIAAPGFDNETGHGLINCYRAVKEVLRRKAIREGTDAAPYTGRTDGDALDLTALKKRLGPTRLVVVRVLPKSSGAEAGLQPGDVIVTFNGRKVQTLQQLQVAKRQAARDKPETVPLTIRRGQETMALELKPGVLGIMVNRVYEAPVFE